MRQKRRLNKIYPVSQFKTKNPTRIPRDTSVEGNIFSDQPNEIIRIIILKAVGESEKSRESSRSNKSNDLRKLWLRLINIRVKEIYDTFIDQNFKLAKMEDRKPEDFILSYRWGFSVNNFLPPVNMLNSIYKLEVQRGGLTKYKKDVFLSALRKCGNLRILKINGCYLGHNMGLAIKLFRTIGVDMRIGFSQLTSINMSNSDFSPGSVEILAPLILEYNPRLKHLDISNNKIGDVGLSCIATSLYKNYCLNSIILSGNQIGKDGIIKLAEALKNNTSVQHLNLDWNSIGDEGIVALASILDDTISIKHLSLRRNKIGPIGVLQLAHMLEHNSKLKFLDLSDNHFNADGVSRLATALKKNTELKYLGLEGLKLTDSSISFLAESLKVNTSLQILNLESNSISKFGLECLMKALRDNTSIKSIPIRFNPFSDRDVKKFRYIFVY